MRRTAAGIDASPLHSRRAGVGNAELLAIVALIAVVSVLAQIASGELILPSSQPAVKPSSTGTAGSQPPIVLLEYPTAPSAAADYWVDGRIDELATDGLRRTRSTAAFRHMDPELAAGLLGEMDPEAVTEILAELSSRNLARILEQAPPQSAAQWVADLLAEPFYPAIPEEYQRAAAQAGLIPPVETGAVEDESGEPAVEMPAGEDGSAADIGGMADPATGQPVDSGDLAGTGRADTQQFPTGWINTT